MKAIKKKRKGFADAGLLIQLLIYCMIMGVIATSIINLQSSQFSALSASRVELEAQQWAEIKADIVRLIGYDSITGQSRRAIDGSNRKWEDEVIVGPETNVGPDDGKQKIVLINIYQPGDSLPKFTLKVPLSSKGSVIKRGMILAWSGSINAIPRGWALCNGSNGTPDLRDRFILGGGGRHSINSIGGEEMHTLTIAEMPSHNHNGIVSIDLFGNNDSQGDYPVGGEWWGSLYSTTLNLTTSNAGGNQPHNNMPPYYTLAYIMKVGW